LGLILEVQTLRLWADVPAFYLLLEKYLADIVFFVGHAPTK
jgi:hypothetical protein